MTANIDRVSSGTSLTFTSTNWATAQNVTLAAAQDSDTTNGSRAFTVASSGLTSVNVTATEADDDVTQTQAPGRLLDRRDRPRGAAPPPTRSDSRPRPAAT